MGESAKAQAVRTADPFGFGVSSAEAMGLLYPGMPGLCIFPDLVGPIVLLRRKLYPGTVSDWHIAGTAHPDATTIVNGPGCTHDVSSGWHYAAARAFGNGFVGEFSVPVSVHFDDAGDIIAAGLPNWPKDVNAAPVAAGEYLIRWTYQPESEGCSPADFAVYAGVSAAAIDYDTAIGTVTYNSHLYQFEYTTSEGYSDGDPHCFAVRARDSDGNCELNEYTTAVVNAEAGTPGAAVIDSGLAIGLGR